jgi:acyl-coenzyme A thioesterase PaaI-like protein
MSAKGRPERELLPLGGTARSAKGAPMSAKGRPERPPGAPNSSSYQGFLRDLMLGPRMLRRAMNLWPPFVGAGIKVTQISADYRDVEVRLALGLLNRNYVGTQFGGSLFAMTDPFFMLMLLHNLGPEYVVWDKAGKIDYLKPGRGSVKARFHLDEADVVKARRATTRGRRYLPRFAVDVVDRDGDVIARVEKTLYVRRKRADDVAPAAKPAPRPRGGAKR